MKLRSCLLTAVVLSAVATLVPLAYAAPADPTWIDGVWDDGDQDDVMSFIISNSSTIEPQFAHDGTIHAVAALLPQADERAAHFRARASPPTRAPPLF